MCAELHRRAKILVAELLQSIRGKVFQNIGVTFLAQLVSKFLFGISFVIVVRGLGQSDMGVYSVIQSIVVVTSGVMLQGVNWGLVQRIPRSSPEKRSIFLRGALGFVITLTVVVGSALFVSSIFFPSLFGSSKGVARYGWVFPFAILAYGLSGHGKACLEGGQYFKESAVVSVVQNTFWLLSFGGLYALQMLNLKLVLLLLYVGYSFPFLYVKVAKRNVYNYKGDKISAVRVIWRDSKWYVAYGGLLTVASQVDLLSMYHFFPLDQVGVYAVALKIFSVSMLGIAALQSVLLPRLATAHGREELESLFWRMVRLSVPIAMFAGFFLIVAAKYIVLIVGGEKFLGAVTPFRVLSLAIAESILLSTHSQFLMVAKRYLSLLLSGVVYFLTSVILSYTLIRAFGSVGAAFAVLGSLLITHLFVTSSVVFMFRSHQPIPT